MLWTSGQEQLDLSQMSTPPLSLGPFDRARHHALLGSGAAREAEHAADRGLDASAHDSPSQSVGLASPSLQKYFSASSATTDASAPFSGTSPGPSANGASGNSEVGNGPSGNVPAPFPDTSCLAPASVAETASERSAVSHATCTPSAIAPSAVPTARCDDGAASMMSGKLAGLTLVALRSPAHPRMRANKHANTPLPRETTRPCGAG